MTETIESMRATLEALAENFDKQKAEIKRLRRLCGYAERLLCNPPTGESIPGYEIKELCKQLRQAAEAKEK